MTEQRSVTQLLLAWSAGEEKAREQLIPQVYTELHRIASRHFAHEHPGHLWQPTALVHEAYQRLVDINTAPPQNRAHFFALASRIMRNLLVDYARAQQRQKRGAGQTQLALDEGIRVPEQPGVDLLGLNDALSRLARIDSRQARVVELRFFVGLTNEEIAEVTHTSVATVKRDWQTARAWLRQELGR